MSATPQTYPYLSAADTRVLTSRNISAEVAAARGYVSVSAEQSRAFGFAGQQALSGLAIPRRNTQGVVDECAQLRPHTPRLDDKGRPRKYELPAGAKQILDVTPFSQPFINDLNVPVIVTESILKADAIQSESPRGVLCVTAINGTYGWRSAGAPLTDFKDLTFCEKRGDKIGRRRTVYIAFDSDTATNPKVAIARHEFTEFLTRRGAKVLHIHVPAGAGGEKQGIDDALANGYVLRDLIHAAHAPQVPDLETFPDDPYLQRIHDLEETVEAINAQLRAERAERAEERRLLGDARRPAQERINAYVLAWETERIAKHQDGVIHHAGGPTVAVDATGAILTSVKDLAVAAGTTAKHFGDSLKKWEHEGVISRPPVTRVATGREIVTVEGEIKPGYVSITRIRPNGEIEALRHDFLEKAPEVQPKAKRRPTNRCSDHPEADIIRRTTSECSVCHQEVAPERISRHRAGTPVEESHPTDTLPTTPRPMFLNTPEVISETTPPEETSPSPPRLSITTPAVHSDIHATLDQADHATDRDNLHRIHADLGEQLGHVAKARGRQPVPKTGSSVRNRDALLFSLRDPKVQAQILREQAGSVGDD